MNGESGSLEECDNVLRFIVEPCLSGTGEVPIGGPGELGQFLLQHLLVSVIALVAAIAISLPIGLYLGHKGRGEFFAIAVANVGRAVPALALLAFFLAYIGGGVVNVSLVLLLLAAPPILQNTYTAIRQVEPDVVDAARGMGMREAQIVRKVELPVALPSIIDGIRFASLFVLATATIAPLANVRTLGEPIINANIYGQEGQYAAAIIVALVALIADRLILLLQRAVTPEGLKIAAGSNRPRRLQRLTTAIQTRRERTT